MTTLVIDEDRLLGELRTLAGFSEAPATAPSPGETAVTRIVFSPQDTAARAWLHTLAQQAGLHVRVDPVGNTFFRWPGSEPDLPAVATGSHIDAIPNAGMYDGTVGVLGVLEAIRALQSAGFRPRRSIELILFTSEEPTRFGIGCLGSRLLSSTLAPASAQALRDPDGRSLDEVRAAAGYTGPLTAVAIQPSAYAAFVELHIEQGPLLERDHIDLGIVTAIAAPASGTVTLTGQGGHAGALLMPQRHDALTAASELILAVESAARGTGAEDTVATVGICQVFPGAVNSVPSRVTLSLDVRDIDAARRDSVLSSIQQAADRIQAQRGVAITTAMLNADPPATCDPAIVEAISRAGHTAGATSRRMVSRAYHDSLFMAALCPVSMIFIPCRGGVSHRPDEYASPQSIMLGTQVLARTLAELSSQ